MERQEKSRLQDLLDKERADFAAARETADSHRNRWKAERDEKIKIEARLRAALSDNEKLFWESPFESHLQSLREGQAT